jgi:hydrogenase-4 membrane subunit HyfE
MVYVKVISQAFDNVPPGPSYPVNCYSFTTVTHLNINNKILFIIQITLVFLLLILCVTLFILACLNNYSQYNYSKKFVCNLMLIIIISLLFGFSFLLKSNC